jgi:hypothetical protein
MAQQGKPLDVNMPRGNPQEILPARQPGNEYAENIEPGTPLEMKRVKVLRGTVEVPRSVDSHISGIEHHPLFGRAGHPGHFSQAMPGELVNLPADEADRLAAVGVVEIM